MSYRSFHIGAGFIVNLTALFGGVTLYLNDKLKADIDRIKEEDGMKKELLRIHQNSSSRYDKFYSRIEVRNKINKYKKILTSYSEGKILETGCGTGRNFTNYKQTDDVLAIDYASKMLEISNEKITNKSGGQGSNNDIVCDNIKLANYDCEELIKEIGENKFDTVIDFMNMQSYSNPELVLSNIKGVLKNKGKLIVICRGLSDYYLINMFYKVYAPTTIMRYGVDYSRNWDELFLNDKELKCMYKERKNYGKTYLYMFELNKDSNSKV